MNLRDINGGGNPDPVRIMCAMLLQAEAQFSADGYCPPQASIVCTDGTVYGLVGVESESFDIETFANDVERKFAAVRGVGVMSIAETWLVDQWDGVTDVAEMPDRYEALAATIESRDQPNGLYVWPIRRDADGTARLEQMRPPVPCAAGLFRLRII